MQRPPSPGPGVNHMYPNSLEAAASMTSQASRPSLSDMRSTSCARPIFTVLNLFSSSLTISADFADETGTTVSIARA